MRSLAIVLTRDCNLRCQYCFVEKKRQGSIDWSHLRRTLDTVLPRAAGDFDIAFTGGEPLLEFETLTRVVSYVNGNLQGGRTVRWTL